MTMLSKVCHPAAKQPQPCDAYRQLVGKQRAASAESWLTVHTAGFKPLVDRFSVGMSGMLRKSIHEVAQ